MMMARPKPKAAVAAAEPAPAPAPLAEQPLLAAEEEEDDQAMYLEQQLGGLQLSSMTAPNAPVGFDDLQTTVTEVAEGGGRQTRTEQATPSAPHVQRRHDHRILRVPDAGGAVGRGPIGSLAPYPQHVPAAIAVATALSPEQEAVALAAMHASAVETVAQTEAVPLHHRVVHGVAVPVAVTQLGVGASAGQWQQQQQQRQTVYEGALPTKHAGTVAAEHTGGAHAAEPKLRRPASPGPAALAAMQPEEPLYSRTEAGDYKSVYDEQGGYKSIYEEGGQAAAGAGSGDGSGLDPYTGPTYGTSADGEYKSAYDEGYGGQGEYKPAEYKSVYES